MDLYGLVGHPLTHSFSPDYFEQKFSRLGVDARYQLFDLERIDDLPAMIRANPGLRGFNVTIPYKQQVMSYLDEVDHHARYVGAVNTVVVRKVNGVPYTIGYNTDVIGLEYCLDQFLGKEQIKRALILGTGGASRAASYVLRKTGVFFFHVTRSPLMSGQLGYRWIDKTIMDEYRLIINTTPVGQYPHTDEAPDLPYELLTSKHFLLDLIYNPVQTEFMKRGMEQGASVMNGQIMLEQQAEASWKLWQGKAVRPSPRISFRSL